MNDLLSMLLIICFTWVVRVDLRLIGFVLLHFFVQILLRATNFFLADEIHTVLVIFQYFLAMDSLQLIFILYPEDQERSHPKLQLISKC
jgi:hypothetical protein